jgi:hypothetical protein
MSSRVLAKLTHVPRAVQMTAADADTDRIIYPDLGVNTMSDGITSSRRRRLTWPRRAAVLAVMPCMALLVAACGGGSSSNTSTSATGGSSLYQKALAYSECMRAHGVPNFPDPNSNGTIANGQFRVSSRTAMQEAQRACQSLQPSGGGQTSSGAQQVLGQMVHYSHCMRSHGITNFPDPKTTNGGVGFDLAGVAVHSQQYQTANQACSSLQRK